MDKYSGNNPVHSRSVTITQSFADFGLKVGEDGSLVRLDGSRIKHHHAFKEWQYRLKRGERLPRGRFFRGKKPGRPAVFVDEVWGFNPGMADFLKTVRSL